MKRGSGILLHITSLPSSYGIGDLGPNAYRFADFLAETRQTYWQILPLNLTCSFYGNSPYSSFSAFAGNPLLISPEKMVSDGLFRKSDIRLAKKLPHERVDYSVVTAFKDKIFRKAFSQNRNHLPGDTDFRKFCKRNSSWLDDYSLFISLRKHFKNKVWNSWPKDLRDRKKSALMEWAKKVSDSILYEKFLQYVFFSQWSALKHYCDIKGIKVFGDIPIYVNYDSADVWSNPGIFSLDDQKNPIFIAGVPPDYFSETGQLWGHPVYKWETMKKDGYLWWIKRIRHNLKLFHLFRIDHFRGFVGFWQVQSSEKTAINGKWVEAPAVDFFNKVLKTFPGISIIAEDLGLITPDVKAVISHFRFPGMKVLLFAFGDDLPLNPYAPHNHEKNCIVYTGTHDNNTILGWYRKELKPAVRKRLSKYIGRKVNEKNINWELIRLAMMSVADTVIIPMQDILCLDERYRMNRPATSSDNWEWRLVPEQLSASIVNKLREVTEIYGRA